tara:strand:+ start:2688 stop:3017 length:330 start_codon:yes stop_codon:yes gene_type:complete
VAKKCDVHLNSCLVEPQCYDSSTKKALGQTPIYKQVNNDNLLSMNTPDHNETLAAQELCVTAIQAVKQYTFDPGDFEAATVALLARSIELTIKKELILCYQQKPTISNN